MIRIILLCFTLTIISSCERNSDRKKLTGLDSLWTFKIIKINDTSDCAVHYHKGKIHDSIFRIKGQKNGWTYVFSEESGKILIQSHFKNDKKQGWEQLQDENGIVISKTFYYNDKLFGSNYSYYHDYRKQVKNYNCYDFQENNRRVKVYDTFGRVLQNEGLIIGQVGLSSRDSNYKIGHDVFFDFVVSTAPNEKVKAFILEDNKLIEYPFSQNFMFFRKKYHKAGRHIIYAIGKSIDTATNTSLTDTQKVVFDIIDR